MGIKFYDVELFTDTLRRAELDRSGQLLTLGVQDVYCSYDELRAFLHEKNIPARDLPPAEILPTTGFAWAGAKERARAIHQKTLFAALGFQTANVLAMDASDYERPDFLHDLNLPVPNNLENRFDLLFDGGTLEHVFSLKDAFFNVARMLKPGGLAIHHAPVDWPDHGFVNFNPTLFRDFYLANGFAEIDLRFTAVPLAPASLAAERDYRFYTDFPGYLRPSHGLLLWAAYKKIRHVEPTVPVQGRYRQIWSTPPTP
ncbi:MAG TPA: methyltransferase domain-containing protein [Phycisphaerae bacterium]|nr:methyltransferase domain-containing protein [Phycisphaerae bacterium]